MSDEGLRVSLLLPSRFSFFLESWKTNSLDDVVGLGEHLEQRDLAQCRRRDALFLHLFFGFVFFEVSRRSRLREEAAARRCSSIA